MTRLFDYNTDNEMLSAWSDAREIQKVPKAFLSDYGVLGVVNDKPIAAMWLYPVLGVKFCIIENLISNPDSTKEERKEALDSIFEKIHEIAKELGYETIVCMTDNKSVMERVQKYGYQEDPTKYVNFIGVL